MTCPLHAVDPVPLAQPTTDPGVAAAWMIFGLLLAVAIFEVWALQTHHNTISHLFQRLARRYHWFRWMNFLGLVVLGWHLLWGFP